MEMQIISFVDKLTKGNYVFEDKTYYINEEYRSLYYRLHQKKIEVIYLNEINSLKFVIKRKSKLLIILVREINEENENIIDDFIRNSGGLILAGKNKSKNNLFKNIIILENIASNEEIQLELLLGLLNSDCILDELKSMKRRTKVIMGEGEAEYIASNIVISTLGKLNEIAGSPNLDIYILGQEKINLQTIANIEDPISDYLPNSKLRIKQIENKNHYEKIKYLIKYKL